MSVDVGMPWDEDFGRYDFNEIEHIGERVRERLASGAYDGILDVDAEAMRKGLYHVLGCADELEYVQMVEDDPSLDMTIKFDEQWEERKRELASRPENRERCAGLPAFAGMVGE